MIGTVMSLAFYHVPDTHNIHGLNWRLMLGSVRFLTGFLTYAKYSY